MAGSTGKGFNIEVGVSTKEMKAQFKDMDAVVKRTMKVTEAFKKSLNKDWNMDTFIKAQESAQQAVKDTQAEVEAIKEAMNKLKDINTKEAQDQITFLAVKLVEVEVKARKAAASLVDVANSKFTASLQKANTEIDLTKRKLDTLTTGLSMKWDKTTFVQAQATAREAVDKTNDKLKILQAELNRLENDSSTDKTTAEFRELETQIGEVKLEALQAEKNVASINQIKFDRITGTLDKLSNSMIKGGTVLTAGITLPLAYVGKQALETASDLQEVQNVVDVSFKENAKSIDAWSKSLLYTNGISELTAKQNAGLYKSMANGMGVAEEAGMEMAQTLTELIGDVASFNNLSFDVVGNKLKSVFTGETESLKDIGVIMEETNLNAYALANGMEQLNDDMTQAEKVQLRYAFVVDSLKDAQGDFARTIGSAANQTKLAQEQFKSLSIELAEELLPIATDILKWANDVMKSFSGMSDSTKQTTLVILGLAAGLGPAMILLGGLGKVVSGTVRAVNAFKLANDAATVSQAALNAVTAMNPYVLVATAVAALTVGIIAYTAANDEAGKKQREVNEEIAKLESDNIAEASSRIAELELAAKVTVPRIKVLAANVSRSAGETELLKKYIEQLNTVMGYEAAAFDEVTGKVQINTAEINNNITALKNRALADSVSEKVKSEQEKIIAADMELAEKKLQFKELEEQYNKLKENPIGSVDYGKEVIKMESKIGKAKKEIAEQEEILKLSQDLQEKYLKYYDEKMQELPTTRTRRQAPNPATEGLTAEQKARADKMAKDEKETLEARMDLGVYTEQVYYEKLKEIRTKYYGNAKKDAIDMTDFEHTLNKQIYSQEVTFQKERESAAKAANAQRTADTKAYTAEQTKLYKEMYDTQKTLAKDSYEQNKELLKKSYDETKKKLDSDYKEEIARIDEALKHKENSINAAIKAIDKEIEARKRLKQSQEFESQIDVLKGQLAYDKMDDFTRREIEAELKRIEEEKSDYAWELAQNDRKEALNQELTDAKERASLEKANLQEMLDINKAALEETYTMQFENLEAAYQLHSKQLEAMFNTSSVKMEEISNNFVETITKGIEEAIGKLSGMVEKATEATSQIASVQNYASYDNSKRSAEVNIMGTNFTPAQLQRIAQREIDRILY